MKPHFEPTTARHAATGPDAARRTRLEGLARTARQSEPAIAGLIAAVTGWLAATSHASMSALWMSCLLAVGIGVWAWGRRRATQLEMAARALVLIGATYVLHQHGGAPGVFFFWLALTPVYYVFVLKASLGALVAVAAVAELALAALSPGGEPLSAMWTHGAFLLILPMLFAMKLGALSRRAAGRLERERTDRSTALYNRGGLLAHGNVLLATCRAEGRDLTLAVFDCGDLTEARAVYGSRTTRKLIDCIVRKLTLLAGADGLAARTGPTQFTVALPLARDQAARAIERVLGNPGRFELEGCDTEIVLVPDVMVEAVAAAGSLERVHAALCRGLARVQEEQRMRQGYLQRERERHSRPLGVQPLPAAPVVRPSRAPLLDPDPVFAQQIPNTIPMPLSMR